MKKVILLAGILCVLNLTMLKAQTEQGTFFLGLSSSIGLSGPSTDLMSLEFSSSKEKSDKSGTNEPTPTKTSSFNLSPKVGYFIKNNLAVGLDVSMALYHSSQLSADYNSNNHITLFGAGPFVRYYIPTGKILPFIELGGSLGLTNNKYEYFNNTDEYKQSISMLEGGVGVAVPLGERVSFDGMLDYRSITIKNTKNNPNNDRTVMGTIGLKVGFTIFFGRHKEKAVAL